MKPADRNFVVDYPGSASYSASWGPSGVYPIGSKWYAKGEYGGKREPKPKGWKPPKPYSMFERSWTSGGGALVRFWTPVVGTQSYVDSWTGDCVQGQGSPANYISVATSVCPPEWGELDWDIEEFNVFKKAYAKARGQLVNLGVMFAEAGQTASLIASTATKLTRAYWALRRRRFRDAAAILGIKPGRIRRTAAETWLEWRYGWMPLLKDLQGACEHIARSDLGDWKMTASHVQPFNRSRQVLSGSGFSRCVTNYSLKGVVKVRIDYVPNDLNLFSTIGFTNPALIVWELVPYSFCVDWLFDVSYWLQGLDHNIAFASGTVCTTRFCKQQWGVFGTGDSYISGGYRQTFINSASLIRKFVGMRRTVGILGPPPAPPVTWDRLLNPPILTSALALMKTAFKEPNFDPPKKQGGPRPNRPRNSKGK